jgi:hypothetical protein
MGSDDEIEREVATDSDSDNDGQSSSDSASDSDTEPASEDIIPNGHTRILTPGISQSSEERSLLHPEDPEKVDVVQINGASTAFFNAPSNWSEMVADETANGASDLPVIDFADFNGHVVNEQPPAASRPRKVQKAQSHVTAAHTSSEPPVPTETTTEDQADVPDTEQPVASTSSRSLAEQSHKRPLGQTVRQAYQQRLESDPSYVPTVGGFWGHDDRLLDKDLRSLSGWWRVRWQGRRGRGFDRGFAIAGRGRGRHPEEQSTRPVNGDHPQPDGGELSDAPGDVPPIERPWGHDGFEEMKRREEIRRPAQAQVQQPRRGTIHGRGGVTPSRGRGSSVGGGGSPPATARHPRTPFFPPPGRPWFTMRPECAWTKQHEGFLYFDPALKPRSGLGPGLRVRLPGTKVQVIRAPPGAPSSTRETTSKPSGSIAAGSEEGEKSFVVRLPKRDTVVDQVPDKPDVAREAENITTVEEPPIEDVFTVRPQLQTRTAVLRSQPQSTPSVTAPLPSVRPDPAVAQELERLSNEPEVTETNGQISSQTEHARKHSTAGTETSDRSSTRPNPPTLPPIQTAFSPAPQPPATYGSPYAYGPSLPPGVAIGQNGMPYELATGRAVYLQPPPAMYNPRPTLHAPVPMPYVAGHVRHHSEFIPQAHGPSHTPPVGTFVDPSTGAAIFSLPRQSSRIEIRPPTENESDKAARKALARQSSGLRVGSAAFEPLQLANDAQGYFIADHAMLPSYVSADARSPSEGGQPQPVDPAMAYPSYHHQYYYPEAYGYPQQYMDMSHVAAYQQYPDPRTSQPAAYY